MDYSKNQDDRFFKYKEKSSSNINKLFTLDTNMKKYV